MSAVCHYNHEMFNVHGGKELICKVVHLGVLLEFNSDSKDYLLY